MSEEMAKAKIRKDRYGLYVKRGGFLFRPIYTIGNDPNNPSVHIEEGQEVSVNYNGHGRYVRIVVENTVLFWQRHGAYIVARDDEVRHLPSDEVIIQGDE